MSNGNTTVKKLQRFMNCTIETGLVCIQNYLVGLPTIKSVKVKFITQHH